MPLQRAQNATARLVLGLDCQSSITTALRDLHWLPVKHRIAFKVATLMHQACTTDLFLTLRSIPHVLFCLLLPHPETAPLDSPLCQQRSPETASSSLSSVLGWPRCVQLNRLSLAALLHYDQRSRDTENSDPVWKTGLSVSEVPTCGTVLLHLSAQSTTTRPSTVLSKLTCSSLLLTITVSIFYFTIFWLCNARSAGFYLVWLGTITFLSYPILSYHIVSYFSLSILTAIFQVHLG